MEERKRVWKVYSPLGKNSQPIFFETKAEAKKYRENVEVRIRRERGRVPYPILIHRGPDHYRGETFPRRDKS